MLTTQAKSQREWSVKPADSVVIGAIITQVGCPAPIAYMLAARGIDEGNAHSYFHPSLEDLLDPLKMLGMREAVARIRQAIMRGERILIYGDYDVDGTVAVALLKTAIELSAPNGFHPQITYHVPHRIREGYGMQTDVLGQAVHDGIGLVISVDTGIRAFAAAKEAKTLGLDLIVTDHHLPDDIKGVPDALVVINPAQQDCTYGFDSLCGAAVAFKLAHALLIASEIAPERLRVLTLSLLKLVAIATIADSVPLVGENRTIASLGLRELRRPVQVGLRALMKVAEIPDDRAPTAVEVGFRIAPRINAAGRMDVASDVVELLLTRDGKRALELADKLNALNEERRATERRALSAIEDRLEALRGDADDYPIECIVLDDPDWHRGVLGILASRVVDRTGRPALVLMHEGGHAHGSGRSIAGFHLLDSITVAHSEVDIPGGLFSRFGGHAHAVGFSLPSDNVTLLREAMRRIAAKELIEPLLAPQLECDLEINFEDLTPEFQHWFEQCGPFGAGHPEPIFLTRNALLAADVRLIKERHVSLQVTTGDRQFRAVGWSKAAEWIGRAGKLELRAGVSIDLAYRLRTKTNPHFPGLELELVDIRRS